MQNGREKITRLKLASIPDKSRIRASGETRFENAEIST